MGDSGIPEPGFNSRCAATVKRIEAVTILPPACDPANGDICMLAGVIYIASAVNVWRAVASMPLAALVPGAVVFGSVAGILTQDAANFFWDNVNDRLGLGTNVPTSPIHVIGLPEYATNALAVIGGLTVGAFYRITGTGIVMVVI